MSKKYESINQADRETLEAVVTKMTQDSYHKGFNHGLVRKEESIIEIIGEHIPTGKSVAGFLAVCSCSEAIDDYKAHMSQVIKGLKK